MPPRVKQLVPLFVLVVALAALAACTAAQKQTAKSVADVAYEACEVVLADKVPAGKTIDELCKDVEIVKPFVTNILGAGRVSAQLAAGKGDGDAATPPAP